MSYPKNPIYTSLQDNIIENHGYDDDLVDHMLRDILVRSSHKYKNETENQHKMLQNRRRNAESTETTIARSKMMFLTVCYVPLGTKTKHMNTVAVKWYLKLQKTISTFNHGKLEPFYACKYVLFIYAVC